MDDFITVQEASKRLAVSEKTIYRYLESHKLTSRKFGITHMIERGQVEQLAVSRHVQKDEETHMRDRVNTLYEIVGALDFRVRELEEKLRAIQTLPTVQTRSETQETPVTIAPSQGNIPAGYVALSAFLHGLSASTVKRNVQTETGDWRDATGHVVNRALSPEQQSAFYEWAHNRPGFVACPECPHTV